MKRCLLAAILISGFTGLCCSRSSAQGSPFFWSPQVQLTYTPGSTHKIEQVNGDCDWSVWDATITADASGKITNPDPVCVPTLSQTVTRADVLGQGLGYSFEHDGQLIFLFGDTIGGTTGHGDGVDYSPWTAVQNSFQYQAGDTMAWSTTQRAEDGLLLNYFLADGSSPSHALVVQPVYPTSQCYPDTTCGTNLPMGADDIPNSGISLDGQIYIVANSGTLGTGGSGHDHSFDYSVLTKFDAAAQTFAAGRTISSVNTGGHFVYLAMQEFPLFPGPQLPGFNDDLVAIFGVGLYRQSNIYLSIVPKSTFESGEGTVYFTGTDKLGFPTWGQSDGAADVPVVTDLDPSNPTIGNLSVTYSQRLGLWLMTFDGGRAGDPNDPDSPGEAGVYFTYATAPWGPWATPQKIFNDCQNGALGSYMFYYARSNAANGCPTALPPGTTTFPASAGPAGPTIGPQVPPGNPPLTTRAGAFAPEMIGRFTEIQGNTLKIYYTLSTWNPYAVVEMESDFQITPQWPGVPWLSGGWPSSFQQQ
jgi:hypothetical protein